MKKINKLRLNHLSKTEMGKREMIILKGGTCGCVSYCPCRYEGPQCPSGDNEWGGATTAENDTANSNADSVHDS